MNREPNLVCRLLVLSLLLLGLAGTGAAGGDSWADLSTLGALEQPTARWGIVGGVELQSKNPRMLAAKPGSGVLWNGPEGRTRNLVTKQKFGDIEVHLEFLIPRRSNSGVKFEGLYEIQIFDSYGVKKPTASDCGGIYPRAELLPRYHHIDDGIPPRVNAARPAGEWQTLDVIFLAPRFDGAGKKVANARFVKVMLNGQVVHEDVEAKAPTGHAWKDKEIA